MATSESDEDLRHQTIQLTLGTQLGPYEIERPLGAGGMGQVYKARDTRLGRAVAIKISAEQFTNRFEREARAISALNHPHICTLYDVGQNYLVMELVEGETLAARLRKGPLPVDGVVRYGAQIADALVAAHAQGITHRDLKPANIMVTKSGVKVLDFGLAKVTNSDDTLTVTHAVMGTPAYMAPEQLEGKPSDARTDIYALGLVLHEMATGKRLSQGGSPPAQLAHVIERCLAKEQDDRWQSARDVKAELEWAGTNEPAKSPSPVLRMLTIGLGVVALVAAAVAVWSLRQSTATVSQPLTRFTINLPSTHQFPIDAGLPLVVAVEPHSGDIFYVASSGGVHRLYRRKRDELQALPVAGTEGALMPFFSPDGQWVGFAAGGELKKMALAGGPPVTLCSAPNPAGACWGRDDTIVFAPTWGTGLMKVSAKGGSAEPLTQLNTAAGEITHRDPHVLPGGQVLFTVWAKNGSRIELLMPATGQRRVVTDGRNPIYLPTGHLILARGGSLVAGPFDAQTLKLTGTPVPVLGGVKSDSKTHFAVGPEGTLAYVPAASAISRLVWVDRQGKARAASDDRRPFFHPRLSPDGTKVVIANADDIWVYELGRGTRSRLSTGIRPIWTEDGKHVLFAMSRQGLYSAPADGSSEPRLVLAPQGSAVAVYPLGWSADGRFLAFSNVTNETSRDIWVLPLGGKPAPFVATPLDERAGTLSPNGRWLLYALKQTGRDEEVYIQAYPGPGGRWLISTAGGMEPVWSRDGREIFYRTLDGARMMAASVQTSPTFSAALPRVLFEGRYALASGGFYSNYDVSKDGREFLMLEPEEAMANTQINVVLNWFEELKRRVPAGGR